MKYKKRLKIKKNSVKIAKFKKIKFYFYIFLLTSFLILATLIYLFETKVVPTAIVISENYVTNLVGQEINTSVEKTIKELNLLTENFFNDSSVNGTNHFLNVNSILINNLCLNVSNNLTEELKKIESSEIELPMGTFLGFSIFSNIGPKFKIIVNSVGSAVTDYETKFETVGINQVNFQVFLNISTQMSIINPFYKKNIVVTRKLMIVNTVFNGSVPNTYLNIPNF